MREKKANVCTILSDIVFTFDVFNLTLFVFIKGCFRCPTEQCADFKIPILHSFAVRSVCASSEGVWGAAGLSNGQVVVVDFRNGMTPAAWKAHDSEVTKVSVRKNPSKNKKQTRVTFCSSSSMNVPTNKVTKNGRSYQFFPFSVLSLVGLKLVIES